MATRIDSDLLSKVSVRLGDAVVDPAIWPDIMQQITVAVGATGAALLQSDVRTPDIPRTAGVDEYFSGYFAKGWHLRDIRAERAVPLLLQGAQVITDQDILTPREMQHAGLYAESLLPHGLQWFAAIGFWANEALWGLSIQRTVHEGPFGKNDKRLLAPLAQRLTETATLSTAVGRAVLSGMTSALNFIRQPAVVVHQLGFVLHENAAAAAGFDDEIRVKDRRLFVRDKDAMVKLDRLIELIQFTSDTVALPAEPIVIRRTKKPPVVLRVLPIDGAARSVFLGARAVLLLVNLTPRTAPEPSVLSQAFNLTAAQARVASLLVEGRSVAAIARGLGVAPNTVRMQLKAIFAKTGVHRQAELVSLLSLQSFE